MQKLPKRKTSWRDHAAPFALGWMVGVVMTGILFIAMDLLQLLFS